MTHTPGPWVADSWYVGPKDLPTLVKVNPNGPLGHDEIIANARLIAAAPAMLEALYVAKRALAEAMQPHLVPGLRNEYDIVAAAIATATGEA